MAKEFVSYDQVSVTQRVAGFGRIMQEENYQEIREDMLDYLMALFEDANDFSWDVANASYLGLLCRLDQRRNNKLQWGWNNR